MPLGLDGQKIIVKKKENQIKEHTVYNDSKAVYYIFNSLFPRTCAWLL